MVIRKDLIKIVSMISPRFDEKKKQQMPPPPQQKLERLYSASPLSIEGDEQPISYDRFFRPKNRVKNQRFSYDSKKIFGSKKKKEKTPPPVNIFDELLDPNKFSAEAVKGVEKMDFPIETPKSVETAIHMDFPIDTPKSIEKAIQMDFPLAAEVNSKIIPISKNILKEPSKKNRKTKNKPLRKPRKTTVRGNYDKIYRNQNNIIPVIKPNKLLKKRVSVVKRKKNIRNTKKHET